MELSEERAELFTALSEAQKKLKNPKPDKVNPHFNSQFVSLGAHQTAYRPILAEVGLSLLCIPVTENGSVGMRGMLTHSSGQFLLTDPVLMTPDKDNPQGVVSAGTYLQRLIASCLLQMAVDADDDGNAASTPVAPAKPKKAEVERTPGGASIKSVNLARAKFVERGIAVKGHKGETDEEHYTRHEQNLLNICDWLKAHDFPVKGDDPLIHYAQGKVSEVIETLNAEITDPNIPTEVLL